jgi:20S proteasome alpha/beta subunit
VTCIIGMYYNSGKGAVVIADSRTMIGGDYSHGQKVFEVEADTGIVFSSSGLSGIAEKLLPNVRAARSRARQTLPSEIVNVFEDEMAELYNRYKMTRPYRFGSDETLLNAFIGFMDQNIPQLHCLYENGYAEVIREFHAVGHGARHARNILRTLYEPSISKDRAIEIGVHALVEVAKIDAMVDDSPQIAILEQKANTSSLEIMNRRRDGTFDFECAEIKKIIDKLAGIEEKRTRAFHLLLDGNHVVKKKFDKTLKEYSHGTGRSEEAADTTKTRSRARKRRKGSLPSRRGTETPAHQ